MISREQNKKEVDYQEPDKEKKDFINLCFLRAAQVLLEMAITLNLSLIPTRLLAVQDGDGSGASESATLLDRIGGDDDRRRITTRLHDEQSFDLESLETAVNSNWIDKDDDILSDMDMIVLVSDMGL
ncbi:hypothetical protein YC2023_031372 [Brassica napus]